ncbi:unnamed protein product [Ectocarpus sp. CCAP 1310/34]|nr:unnamed protein product [Ectocarpus sp. CCAP 1310/34]
MKATQDIDIELLRSLVEVAMMKGFRGGKLEEAIAAVAQYDRQQAVVAMMRSLPERLMSKAAEVARDVRRRSDIQLSQIAGLEEEVLLLASTVKGLQHSAAIDAARLASERTAAKAASDDAAALAQTLRADVKRLQDTVVNLETVAATDAAKFLTTEVDLRAELVAADGTIDSLKSTVRQQRQDLASCQHDMAEVDEASFTLSLLAGESTHLLRGGLQPATPRPAEATTWAAAGLSAAHEARQRTCGHEEEERQRQALEEEMVDLQNEVDEAETAADSCAASLEKLDEQTVAVLTAVEKTVGAQSTRLGEIGDVALSFTRQLLDDLSGCRQQVVEVEERAMDRLEETMASEEESTYMHSSASCVQACLERSQHHRRERSSGEFVHRRGARETQAAFRACAAGLERLDSQSLDLARFLADKAMQAGAPVSIANAVEAPKPPGYGLLDSLFRPRGVSDDAMVKIVPSRVG